MSDTLSLILVGILFMVFLYFGYRDDYKRNPRSFVRTILAVPLGVFAAIFGWLGLAAWLKKWLRQEEES